MEDGFELRNEDYDFINPSHYKQYSHEVIDMMVRIYGVLKTADYCELTAFKYSMRIGFKPDQPVLRDLEKRDWYLNKATFLRTSHLADLKSQEKSSS